MKWQEKYSIPESKSKSLRRLNFHGGGGGGGGGGGEVFTELKSKVNILHEKFQSWLEPFQDSETSHFN